MIQKRTRKELYDKFRQGAIPSGADFADFIRSQLNLLDDGIDVSDEPEDPVCFRGRGEDLNYIDFADNNGKKTWRISGHPEKGSAGSGNGEVSEGLNFKSDNTSKLFVGKENGMVGINTDRPEAKLHIIQNSSKDALRIDDEASDETPFVITSAGYVGIGIGHGDDEPEAKLHVKSTGTEDIFCIEDTDNDSTPLIVDSDGRVGIGYKKPKENLTINGGVTIGDNKKNTGNSKLYVNGDVTVTGNIVANTKVIENGYELIPRGVIVMWSGTSAPGGWALCDGQNSTPDLRSRFIVGTGKGNGLSDYQLNNTGGLEKVQLTEAELASHIHGGRTEMDGQHQHKYQKATGNVGRDGRDRNGVRDSEGTYDTTGGRTVHDHGLRMEAVGENVPHENRPPYYALAFIMKL